MRKYQQLILLVISCASVAILLMYKSENNRLKYVLQVVNFFGRSDVAVLRRLDNSSRDDVVPVFTKPLPVWQQIGDAFHAYSAYWNRNDLVAGGEAHALVVGKTGAVINFHCGIIYDHGTKVIPGKFRFQFATNESQTDDKFNEFTIYNFFCRTTRDFDKRLQPESVAFTDYTPKSLPTARKIRLRLVKTTSSPNERKSLPSPMQATICVDLVSFNSSSRYARNEEYLLQFFLVHQALGVGHFIVYNFDEIPYNVMKTLERTSLYLHQLPFNFPFGITNATSLRVRRIIETDCLLRNINRAHHTLLLTPSEFFYPSAKFAKDRSLQETLQQYPAAFARFELATFAVCIDDKHKLLVDNPMFDPEIKSPKTLLYRLNVPLSTTQLLAQSHAMPLPTSVGFVHRYIHCLHVGQDGLHDWRNSVREDFMKSISAIRNEVDLLI